MLPEPRLVREVGAAGHQQPDRGLTQRDPHRRQRRGIEVGQRFGLYAQHVPEQVVRVKHRETGIHQARSRLINVGHGHHLRRKRLSTFREGRKCQARVAAPPGQVGACVRDSALVLDLVLEVLDGHVSSLRFWPCAARWRLRPGEGRYKPLPVRPSRWPKTRVPVSEPR